MKNLAILLLMSASALAQVIAPVANAVASSANTNNVTTPARTTTGANFIFVAVSALTGASGTVSDAVTGCASPCNTWIPITTYANAGNGQIMTWFAKNATVGAAHTVTFTGAGSYASISWIALSNVDTFNPLDAVGMGAACAATTCNTGFITPSRPNEVWLSAMSVSPNASVVITTNTGTLINSAPGAGGAAFGIGTSYAVQSTPAAAQGSWTVGTSAWAAATSIVSFKAISAAAGPTISAVAYTNLSAYSAVFTWSTGADNADSQVLCGVNGGASGTYATYSTQISDPVLVGTSDFWAVTAHRLGINLPASYTGHCVVLSTNQAGGTTISADQLVTTPAAPVNVPIGIASVSPRINLTNGAGGYSGDIDFMAATADGEWIMAGNDGAGKAINSTQYCCVDTGSAGAHLHMSKWPTMTTRSMLLGQDTSTPSSPIHNVFGPEPSNRLTLNEPYWEITSGSCAANVATVHFEDRGYTIPVGTPVWVAGVSPAGYNAPNVAITASTATSLQYAAACPITLAWTGGGTVALWNDGANHFQTFGIDSVNGLVCITADRQNAGNHMFRLCSTDYFAHSFNNGHNAPAGPATAINLDLPLPSTPCFFTGCISSYALPVVPSRDYGGANQTTFPTTWLAGDENYIYSVGTQSQLTAGYILYRDAYADNKLVDGTRRQAYIGTQACDDRMLYNANWSANLASGTTLNSQISTYGNSFSIVTAPDFNGFIGANWTALPGAIPNGNYSQSAGATLYDMGPWLTCTAAPIGSVNRDETDINYFPTWSFLVPASYSTVSSGTPIRATVQLRQSGSYLGDAANPAANHYGPNLYTINLAQRWTGPKGNGGATFSYAGGKRGSFVSSGLDLLYTFQDASGTQVVTNSSPNDTLGIYSTALAQAKIALYDRYGLFSPGFPVDGMYGSPGTHGYPFFVTTPYAVQNDDFTLAVVFAHVDTANTGPPVGECVIYRASLRICRNGTTANSWLVTVGATTSGPLAVTCDGGANFCGLIVNRVGSTAKIYSTAGVRSNTFPLTALATITDGTALANDALVVGARADGTLQFQGWISALAVYNRSLRDHELQHFVWALRTFEAGRGITLP